MEISVEIETFGYRLQDTESSAEAKPRTISAVCIAGTNEWRIENSFAGAQPGQEDAWWFDGTNVYQRVCTGRTMSQENSTTAAKTDAVPGWRAQSNVTIYVWETRDGLPLSHAAVNIPWLALCSGAYLQRSGRLLPLPAALLRHTRDRFAHTDVTTTFEEEFGLPRTVDLFTSKSLLAASENHFDEEYFFGERYADWKKKIVSDLQEGLLTFHYAVLEATNFQGRTFPLRFEFFQNGRKYEQDGNWFCHGTGRVKSLRASTKPESLFVPNVEQRIVDCRFRDGEAKVHSLLYTSSNAFVGPTNAPELQEKFKAQVNKRLFRSLIQK